MLGGHLVAELELSATIARGRVGGESGSAAASRAMKLTQLSPRLRYHPDAYRYVFEALQFTQEKLHKPQPTADEEDSAHISGRELLDGIRELALRRFGMLARDVFRHWGVNATEDFGKIVFELVERGEMRKTEHDRISDFFEVYDFQAALDDAYLVPTQHAFS